MGATKDEVSRTARRDTGSAAGRITVQRLTKTYERIVGRQLSRTHALQEIGFAVEPHEFVSIIGPSGCGKSTVMKILAGLLPATSGEVAISGFPVTGPGPDRACVFQSPGLMPWRTVQRTSSSCSSSAACRRASAPSAPKGTWTWSRSRPSATTTPRSSPAGCSSGWAWPAPWRSSLPSCSWTSPSAPSMR